MPLFSPFETQARRETAQRPRIPEIMTTFTQIPRGRFPIQTSGKIEIQVFSQPHIDPQLDHLNQGDETVLHRSIIHHHTGKFMIARARSAPGVEERTCPLDIKAVFVMGINPKLSSDLFSFR